MLATQAVRNASCDRTYVIPAGVPQSFVASTGGAYGEEMAPPGLGDPSDGAVVAEQRDGDVCDRIAEAIAHGYRSVFHLGRGGATSCAALPDQPIRRC